MSACNYKDLLPHVGHAIGCVTYGENKNNVALECIDCNEVLLDFDKPAQVTELDIVNYIAFWHGDHNPRTCEVVIMLRKYDDRAVTFQELYDTWLEVDGNTDSLKIRLSELTGVAYEDIILPESSRTPNEIGNE